ncbi:MAG TPA: hypothetical protein VIR38_14720 [Thalassobaculum sp.]
MDLVLWIAAAWLGVSVVGAFAVAAFIRMNRGAAEAAPAPAVFSQPDPAAPLR